MEGKQCALKNACSPLPCHPSTFCGFSWDLKWVERLAAMLLNVKELYKWGYPYAAEVTDFPNEGGHNI